MSEYQVIIQQSTQKQLRLVPVEICNRLDIRINALANDPRPAGCIKLKGQQNRWRIRVGDYRVIYTINDTTFTIFILKVAHRREVY
ncbi:type II toxin-antitoxin system RelE/ParE family toxin [Microcoleus sp. LEGE 07076]|uniref:type II toxin-antitoxin system RelE/ParE family toxin n=1 Tax=Microcoleus sp. LEGE 07076 TaxID=915322 RepID=UPI001881F5E7|nr:type II toxin-antitoxin system RelE/ParE family toxin [Microcoleus sp. LEGE 07076]